MGEPSHERHVSPLPRVPDTGRRTPCYGRGGPEVAEGGAGRSGGRPDAESHRMLALGASLLILVSAAAGEAQSALPSGPIRRRHDPDRLGRLLRVALMAEIYAQVLEANGLTVERKLNTGPRDVTWAAIQAGTDINSCPSTSSASSRAVNVQRRRGQRGRGSDPDASPTPGPVGHVRARTQTPAVDTNAFVVARRPPSSTAWPRSATSRRSPVSSPGVCPGVRQHPVCSGALAAVRHRFRARST